MEEILNHTKILEHYWDPLVSNNLTIWLGQVKATPTKLAIATSFLPLILFIVVCSLSYAHMTCTRSAKLLAKFPGFRKFPIIGSIWVYAGPAEAIRLKLQNVIKKYGRRLVIWKGHIPYVILVKADDVQKVLSSSKHLEKGSDYTKFQWVLGNGLITSPESIWREDRKLLSPSFKYQRFDGFLNIFNKHSEILVSILAKTFERERNVVLHPILCRATMDFINESALGEHSQFQYEYDTEIYEAVHNVLENFRTRLLRPWLTLPIIWDVFGLGRMEAGSKAAMSKNIKRVIKERKELMNAHVNAETSSPFIDALLPTTKSDEDILSHVLTIFGAGFETTATGMNYTMLLLALNPDCQRKVHEELDTVFGNDKRPVTFGDLAELKYLEMCVKESLRLYPPAPFFLRTLGEDVNLDGGLVIPAGCNVLFCLYELHRDPETFTSPETFDPERFLPEKCVDRHPYSYIPFSIGPRNCLGMRYAMVQMKVALAHILRRFRVETMQTRESLEFVYGMVLEPLPPIRLTLCPRH